MPAARAAASREPPSSARASIRRAARASRHRAASRRSSPPPSSRRVIATTIGPLPTGPCPRINRRGPRDAPGTRPVRNNGRWYDPCAAGPRIRITSGSGGMDGPILILGGTGGIGQALARRLAAQDRPVHLAARGPGRLAVLAGEIGAGWTACDVLDEAAL